MTPPTDRINRSLCFRARHCKRRWRRLAARDELILRNQSLIRGVVRRLAARSALPFEDLVSEGQLGLMTAIQQYRFELDKPFNQYARVSIYRWVQRAVLEQGGIIAIRNIQWRARASARTRLALERALSVLSMDATFGDRYRLGDAIPAPAPDVDPCETRDVVAFLLSRLPAREQVIVSLHFGLGGEPPLRDEEIAEYVGLCREAVRLKRHRAIGRMAEVAAWKGVAG